MKSLVMLAALCLAGCGCGHAKYKLTFIPPESEKETPEQAYVCVRSDEDNKADPSGHQMTCVDYQMAARAIEAEGHGGRKAGANHNEL